MNLEIKPEIFKNVVDIREVSSNAIEVWTDDWRIYRVTAYKKIRGGGDALYSANYQELVKAKLGLEHRPSSTEEIWVKADMPAEDGNTMEGVLFNAIKWIDERAWARAKAKEPK